MSSHSLRYLVWNPRAGLPTYAHTSLDSAIAESERLARNNPGQEFFVMEPCGVSLVDAPSIFRRFDDIPF